MPEKKCVICSRLLNLQDDPLSLDCGGDCWGCVGVVEADLGDEAALASVSAEAAQGLRPNCRTARDNIVIVLESWIIQDGNYSDFHVGDSSKFATEFFGDLLPSQDRSRRTERIKNSIYRVTGQVIYSRPNVWAIDFGLRAFAESAPPSFAVEGAWVEGEISLGIDPFFYSAYLNKQPAMPDLYYDWGLTKIECNASEWIKTRNPSGGMVCSRDPSTERWIDVKQTDAWSDDDGDATYLLHLSLSTTLAGP